MAVSHHATTTVIFILARCCPRGTARHQRTAGCTSHINRGQLCIAARSETKSLYIVWVTNRGNICNLSSLPLLGSYLVAFPVESFAAVLPVGTATQTDYLSFDQSFSGVFTGFPFCASVFHGRRKKIDLQFLSVLWAGMIRQLLSCKSSACAALPLSEQSVFLLTLHQLLHAQRCLSPRMHPLQQITPMLEKSPAWTWDRRTWYCLTFVTSALVRHWGLGCPSISLVCKNHTLMGQKKKLSCGGDRHSS